MVRNQYDMKSMIFDMDGVIFDSERAVYSCWKQVAAEHGIRDIERAYMRTVGVNAVTSRSIFLEEFGEDFPYDAYKKEQSAEYHRRCDGGRLPLKPGIRELLVYLRSEGYVTAIASSTRSALIETQVRDGGLSGFFDVIVGGDMTERSKPAPDIFLEAAKRLGAAPSSTYVVEDSYNGIRAAYAGGFIPIMVPDLLPPDDEMREKARRIFSDLFEVAEFLKGEYHE